MNTIVERIKTLRAWMQEQSVDYCLILQADPHQSEYVEDYYKLRSYFSGFTGSAGSLLVGHDFAGLWTDSRYHIQAALQVAGSGVHLFKQGLPEVPDMLSWVKQHARGSRIAADANCMSTKQWQAWSEVADMQDNEGFGSLWAARPALNPSIAYAHDTQYSGCPTAQKLTQVRAALRAAETEACVITNLDDIAWLLNLRASDVAYNPVLRSYVRLSLHHCCLYVEPQKLPEPLRGTLQAEGVQTADYTALATDLKQLPAQTLWVDTHQLNQQLYACLPPTVALYDHPLPIARLRAIKNATEQEGYRCAMRKDGVVWIKFLRAFYTAMQQQAGWTEQDVVATLRRLKQEQALFVEESFHTIAGFGPHGAIGHYAVTAQSNSPITAGNFLVIDTGTHYLDGTTDVTRTLSFGPLSPEQKRDYTLVLKGHIAIATAVFPQGTKGSALDSLARQYLWQAGMNYGHGTGHGVGHLLNVHEGYAWLRPTENNVGYEAGLTMTNEPGLYKEGRWGIRLENLLLVQPHACTEFGSFLRFETLTLAPFDLQAVEPTLLSTEEKDWLNAYHARLKRELQPVLSEEESNWLNTYLYEL